MVADLRAGVRVIRPPRRPTQRTLRLAEVDAGVLGEMAVSALLEQVAALEEGLLPGYRLSVARRRGQARLALEVQQLVRYAQGKASLAGTALDHIGVLRPLYDAAVEGTEMPARLGQWVEGHVDTRYLGASLGDQLGIVITAALARDALGAGRPVTAPHLAVLAGVSPDSVRRLVRQGAIAGGDPTRISADAARDYLAAERGGERD